MTSFVRRVALPAVLLSGGLLIGIGMAELALRVYGRIDDRIGADLLAFDPLRIQVEPHGTVGYRQKPHATFRYRNGTAAHANSLGYRGPEFALEKPSGVVRIVLLGGSTTHGWGVDDSATIDAHMRRFVAERAPTRRFEIINAALDGYDSYQLLERVRSDVVRLSPDLLIVNAGINDVRNARYRNLGDGDPRTLLWREPMERLRREKQHGASFWTHAKHYSVLLRLPGFIRQRRMAAAVAVPDTTVVSYPDAADYFERNLRSIGRLAAMRRLKLIFSTPPSSLRIRYAANAPPEKGYWLRDAETTAKYRDTLAARMRKVTAELVAEGVPAVYLRPEVPAQEFLDDAHLTSRGNAIVAAAFVDAALKLLADDGRPR